MKAKSLISRNPQIQFGAYCIRGTRIPVTTIKGMLKCGDSIDYIMRSYRITREQALAAQNFRQLMELNG